MAVNKPVRRGHPVKNIMPSDKPQPKKLEDHEPGATKEEVMTALAKATKPVKKPEQ